MSILMSFVGKLGKDPELQGEGDKKYAKFSLAVDEYVGKGKGDKDRDGNPGDYKTTWLNATAFNKQAEFIADRFHKGDTMVVQNGTFEFRTYVKKDKDGSETGETGYSLGVLVREFKGPFRAVAKSEGESKSNGNGQAKAAPAPQAKGGSTSRPAAAAAKPAAAAPATVDDDIPF